MLDPEENEQRPDTATLTPCAAAAGPRRPSTPVPPSTSGPDHNRPSPQQPQPRPPPPPEQPHPLHPRSSRRPPPEQAPRAPALPFIPGERNAVAGADRWIPAAAAQVPVAPAAAPGAAARVTLAPATVWLKEAAEMAGRRAQAGASAPRTRGPGSRSRRGRGTCGGDRRASQAGQRRRAAGDGIARGRDQHDPRRTAGGVANRLRQRAGRDRDKARAHAERVARRLEHARSRSRTARAVGAGLEQALQHRARARRAARPRPRELREGCTRSAGGSTRWPSATGSPPTGAWRSCATLADEEQRRSRELVDAELVRIREQFGASRRSLADGQSATGCA